jgi:hypothetical protein
MDTPKSKITKVKMSYIAFLFVFLTLSAGCGIVNDVLEAVNGGNLSIFSSSTAPVVNSTGPSSGESNVPLNRTIEIYFSKAMDKNSVEGSFSIFPPVSGMFLWDGSGRSVIFDPDTALDPIKFYTVTISTGAKDTDGNAMAVKYDWSFLTGSGLDTTPPTVQSVLPANWSIDVGVGSLIRVTFDEPMDQASINSGTFMVYDEYTANISGSISYFGNTAIFTPGGALSYDTSYTVTVTSGVRDKAGNGLSGDYIWDFTTTATVDLTPPIINFVDPFDSMGDVPISTNISVAYSEPMDKPSAESAFKLFEGPMQINGTYSWTGDTMLFNPAGDLKYNTLYTINIGTGAKDIAGNPMSAPFSSGFSTGAFQIILVGETADSPYGGMGDSDWRIKKLDSAKVEDTINWDKTFGDSHQDYPTSSTVDSSGSIYIAGIYDGLMGNGEEVQVMVMSDFLGSLNGKYFVVSFKRDPGDPEESYYVWYQVEGHPYADPGIPGMQSIEIYILENESADMVASRTSEQLNYYSGVSAVWAADIVMITMHAFVDVTDAYDGSTGFSIFTVQQGFGMYDYQWWIKKFDSNGNEDMTNWNKRITVGTEPDGVMEDFAPVTVVTDSKNNVYVSGWVWNGIGSFFDWMIKKYDSNGNEITTNWNKIFPGNGFWDFPTGMAVDSSDNIYVIGSYHNDPLMQGKEDVDWWIKKFDPNGNEDMIYWNKMYDSGFNTIDAPMAIAFDSSDNVYVAGVFADAPTGIPEISDIICASDFDGSLNGTYFTLDTPYDSVYVWYDVDNTNMDPFLTGRRGIRVAISMNYTAEMVAMATEFALQSEFHDSMIMRNIDLVTVENERPGDVEDADMYGVPPGFSIFISQGVNSGNADWVIKKYKSDGTETASAVADYTSGSDGLDNSPTDIAFDSAGNMYVAGYKKSLIDPFNRSQEWVIKKFNAGLIEDKSNWDKVITGGWGGSASSVIVDPDGNVFVSGYLLNESWENNGNTDWVVKKFLPNGFEERSGSTGDEITDSWWFYDSGLHDDGVSMVLP